MSPVRSTCGPRHRSMKSPCWKYETSSPSGDRLDDLDLVLLAARLEELERLVARDDAPLERQVLGDDLLHLRLDALGVLGRERLGVEVVVEAVLDRRPDGDLGVRAQPPHGVRHDVRRRVPHPRQRIVGHVALVPGSDGLGVLHRQADNLSAAPALRKAPNMSEIRRTDLSTGDAALPRRLPLRNVFGGPRGAGPPRAL